MEANGAEDYNNQDAYLENVESWSTSETPVGLCQDVTAEKNDLYNQILNDLSEQQASYLQQENDILSNADKATDDTATITAVSDELPNGNADGFSSSYISGSSPTDAAIDTPLVEVEAQHSSPAVALATLENGVGVDTTNSDGVIGTLDARQADFDEAETGFVAGSNEVADANQLNAVYDQQESVNDCEEAALNNAAGFQSGVDSSTASPIDCDQHLLAGNSQEDAGVIEMASSGQDLVSPSNSSAPSLLATDGVAGYGDGIDASSPLVESVDLLQGTQSAYDSVANDNQQFSDLTDVVSICNGDSAAVTPMDEYRHILHQQQDPSMASQEIESAVLEHDAAPQNAITDSEIGLEQASFGDAFQVTGGAVAQSPTQSEVTEETPSFDDSAIIQQQQNQLNIDAELVATTSAAMPDVAVQSTSAASPNIDVEIASPTVAGNESVNYINHTAHREPTSPTDHLDQQQQQQEQQQQQQQLVKTETKQQQRPPLLPLTIRTDPVEQSWASPAKPDFDTRDQQVHSNASVSPSATVVNRQPVEKVAPPEITKNVRRMFESGEIADRHQVPKRIVRIDDEINAAESSGVFENQPVAVDDDVVRDTGEYVSPRAEVKPGFTKSLLSQWQTKGTEEFRAERQPIVLAETEGVVLENQPAPQRPDVVRQDCYDPTAEMPTPGQARLLRQRFVNRDEQPGPKKDAKAQVLAEVAAAAESGAPSVIENVPNRRPDDVVREEDTVEEVWLRKGYTRDLAGFWSSPQQSSSSAPKAPIELPKDASGPTIYENQPSALDDTVVRSGEYVEEPIAVEKGRAKSMVGMWQNRNADAPVKPRSDPISLEKEIDRQGAGVYENAPVTLEGVVRSTDQVEEVMGQRGLIKNIAERFTERSETEDSVRSRGGTSPRRGVPDKVIIERADGPTVLENEPTPLRPDVIRSDPNDLDQPNVVPGTTRNLVACWKNKEIESTSPQVSAGGRQLQLDLARDAGVYENQPETRTDVIRAEDDQPDIIPITQTRSTRAMWSQKEMEEQQQKQSDRGRSSTSRNAPPEPVRFTPPRERTPPLIVQEDYKSYQSITLSSTSSTPGRLSPAVNQQQQPGFQRQSPSVRSPSDFAINGNLAAQQNQEYSEPVTMKSSAVLVLK